MSNEGAELTSVYEAGSSAEAYLIRDMLIDNEIHAVVAGEFSESAPIAPITDGPTVQVLATHRERALELIRQYEDQTIHEDDEPEPAAGPTWTCPRCGETVDANFSVCWNCETERPAEQQGNG